ncbi:MAG: GvpL/GvpF family gas vesicle protein [Paracoccaceae bacterium]
MPVELIAILDPESAENVLEAIPDPSARLITTAGLSVCVIEPQRPPGVLARLLANAKTLTAPMIARQQLFEHLLRCGDVLPVKPGTVLSDRDVHTFLRTNAELLRETHCTFTGHVQYQLSVRWNPAQALQNFRDAPELEGCHSAQAIAAAAEALRSRLGHSFGEELDSAISNRIALPIDGIDTVLNTVLLVHRDDTNKLDQALERIDAIWTEGLQLKLTGPLPPMSFALVTLRNISPSDRDEARALLGGVDGTDAASIDRAFRARVKQSHADLGGDGDDLSPLVAARNLLKRLLEVDAALGSSVPKTAMLAEIRSDDKAQPKQPVPEPSIEAVS